MDSDDIAQASWLRRHWRTVLALAILLALAAFFRVWFNYDPAVNDGNYRFAGNDDYYHHRVVHFIETEGQHLERDALLNYPVGAVNPRPPLYNWHVAMEGRVLEMFGMDPLEASLYALEWGSAVWGILTVIPVWLIGRFLYSNRAGLWAGFLIAASPAHIQRSGFGLGDHDAFIIFFLVLGFYFLLRALRLTRDDTRVESWRSLRSIAAGFGTYVDHHREGLAYAALAGVSFVAVALAWEGFPYLTAIYGIYYVFQLLANQVRRRDSTGDVLVMIILLGLLTFLPLPYYWDLGATIHKTVTANTYVFAGLVLASLALVPTRDLPSILVLPTLAGVGIASYLVLTFVFPDIGQAIFTANGYFNRSKLYSTIAEAQRTDIGVFVFSIGFMTFFLALIGFVYATIRFFRKRERDQLFIVGWGLVSIYMAFAAARFVFNAAPVFAVLAGWMADKLVGWMNWRERLRDFRSLRHESWAKAIKSTMGARQIAGSIFLGLTLIVPNVWFSFDAGFPSEVRQAYRENHPGNEFISEQTGAFGQGFLSPDWIDVYGWLAQQDLVDDQGDPVPPLRRPAHMAWWDYGFWEVALGHHPTVADNFQNGVQIAGAFLTAQTEKEAIEWFIVRVVEGDWRNKGGRYDAPLLDALRAHDPDLPGKLPRTVYVGDYHPLRNLIANSTQDLDEAASLYRAVSEATGYNIEYVLADLRMLPFDNPQTPSIESGSIFYAPVYLANKNPDDFVQTVYVASGGGEYRVVGYEVDRAGISRQLGRPHILGPDGGTYVVGGQELFKTLDGERIDYGFNRGQGLPIERVRLDLKPAFYQTMYYRGYVGGDGRAPPAPEQYHAEQPGNGLTHFRIVKQAPTVKLLQYYHGAELTGTVTGLGAAVGDVAVEVYDEQGILHDRTDTAADGGYRLLLPFSARNETTGELQNLTVSFTRGGAEVANETLTVSLAQANRRAPFTRSGDLTLVPGTLEVFAYIDRDRDGAYNASIDRPAEGANVSFAGRNATAAADGKAAFVDVLPGAAEVQGNLTHYTARVASTVVRSGGTGTAEVGFQVVAARVNGTALLENGTAVADLPVSVTPKSPETDFTQPAASPRTEANGNFSTVAYPGGIYRIFINDTRTEDGVNWTYRSNEVEVDVQVGQPVSLAELRVTRIRAE